MRVTPVPIPNTMVKTQAADGTSLETVRESRWPPNLKKEELEADPPDKSEVGGFIGANLISQKNAEYGVLPLGALKKGFQFSND